MRSLTALVWHVRLALQEFTRYLELLMLPGGYVLAVSAWASRHWPRSRSE